MTKPLTLIPIAPTGTQRAPAFVHYSDGRGEFVPDLESNVYPPSPRGEALRVLRREHDLTLRDACRLVGMRPVDMSSLETGKATLSDEDWQRLEDALRGGVA